MSRNDRTIGVQNMPPVRPSEPTSSSMLLRGLGWALIVLATLLAMSSPALAEVQPGTVINNIANSSYTVGVVATTSQSNTLTHTVMATPTTAIMNTLRYDPADASAAIINVPASEYSQTGAGGPFFAVTPPLDSGGTPIDLTTADLVNSTQYNVEESIFIIVSDADQDLDFANPDTITVSITTASGDVEIIRLTETGPHTGVFAGHVPTGSGGVNTKDGTLDVGRGSKVTINYTDTADPGDTVSATVQVGASSNVRGLFVTKSAGKNVIYLGDFLFYTVNVEETLGQTATNVKIFDYIPLGFRYKKSSATLNGAATSDPKISGDGRTLRFRVGTLLPGESASITYIVEAAAGVKPGVAINYASARGDGVRSNTAKASVTVRDPFWRDYNIIVGQVLINQCGSSLEDEEMRGDGLPNVRIYLEDGRYVVTDSNGMFHFEGLSKDTHVVQLDLDTLPDKYEIALCEENTAFAGRAYSQFVDLAGGALWRTDFHVRLRPRKMGTVQMELQSAYSEQVAKYTLPIKVGDVPLENLRLTVILPKDVKFISNSSTLEEMKLPEPQEMYSSLTFRLGDVPAGFEGIVRFQAEMSEQGEVRELVTRATLTFNTSKNKNQRLPLLENIFRRSTEDEERVRKTYVLTTNFISGDADLHKLDKEAVQRLAQQLKGLNIDQLFSIGHTDSEPLSGNGVFRDNYELSEARARTISRYLGEILELTPEQLSYMGAGPDKPVADNDSVEGRARNRRVEVKVYTDLVLQDFVLTATKDHSGPEVVETFGERPGKGISLATEDDSRFDPPTFVLELPDYDDKWLNSAEPGFKWLWPEPGWQPFTTSMNIALQHAPGQKVSLFVNGEEVSGMQYEGMVDNRAKTVGVSRWRGVEVSDGANVFEAVMQGRDGQIRLERTIHYAGPPVKAEVVPELSRLLANGRTFPVVAVRLTDANGIPARPGLIGGYAVTAPYEALRSMDGAFEGKAAYIIGYNGIAYLKLYPTTKTGEVVLTLKLRESEEEIRAWLDPELRDWIMVGIAEGTMGFNTLSGNSESLNEHDLAEDFYHDGRLAFFAKGKIKSSWLLTMAYDSEKPPFSEYDQNQSLDPDSFYTLYGDNTREGNETLTSRNIYIKIERRNFYALFGDYNTGLTVTELSRYSRSINGLRSEYKGERFEYNVFASETNQAFVRDEIRGDGTSGLYRLSRDNIVMNSESVRIEVRDRNRSEVILSSTPMSRFVDYTIDYDNGTMFFKEPVDAKDFDLNPVYIVVEYESYDDSDNSMNYGGRAAVKIMDGKVRIGVTGIHEESVGKSGDLLGADVLVKISETTTVSAEAAQSSVEQGGTSTDGSAITLKVEHEDEYFTGSAYARYIGEDFGLGQGASSETGTRKLGFDTRIRTNSSFGYSISGYRQSYLDTGNERDFLDGKVTLGKGNHTYYTGLRRVTDRIAGGEEKVTDQLTAGAKWMLMDNRLVLRVDREQTLFESDENADYPTRTTLGAEYKVSERLTVLGAQEISDSGDTRTETTRAGIRSNPWEGGTVNSTVERQYTDEEMRMFSSLGLKQTWQATSHWTLSAGFDKTTTIKETTATHTADNSDYIAASIGAKFVMEKLTWNSRTEFHESTVLIKRNAITAVSLEPWRGLGLSAGLHLFTEDGVSEDSKDMNLRLAMVYRPTKSKWTVLDRLDLIYEEFASSSMDYDNWRIVNNFNLNYRVPHFWQMSLKYGNKYVKDTIEGKDYQGYTDLTGAEGRYNLTPIWDVGAHVDSLRSWHAGQTDNRLGISLGYNPARNIWLSIGYNFKGFYDRDFSRADYTMNGIFIKFRLKFDQNSAQDAVRWIAGH